MDPADPRLTHLDESGAARMVDVGAKPVSVREVAREAFGIDFANDPGTKPPRYDVRTRHAGVFGGRSGYLYSRDQVLGELRAFVASERDKPRVAA